MKVKHIWIYKGSIARGAAQVVFKKPKTLSLFDHYVAYTPEIALVLEKPKPSKNKIVGNKRRASQTATDGTKNE